MWQLSGQGEASAEGKKEKGEKKGEHEKEGREQNNHTTINVTPQTSAHMSEQALRLSE
jgi:hypothetical protein